MHYIDLTLLITLFYVTFVETLSGVILSGIVRLNQQRLLYYNSIHSTLHPNLRREFFLLV